MRHTDKKAVALRYDGLRAPHVSASGTGPVAERIIETALAHDVPLYDDANLAATLSRLELGEEIPETLYVAVARVIAFAYSITGKMPPATEHKA